MCGTGIGAQLSPVIWIAILVAAYFVGNINPAILIGRARGIDVRDSGSGNAGTTNALRSMGKKVGAAVFLIDAVKGFLPVFFASWYFLFGSPTYWSLLVDAEGDMVFPFEAALIMPLFVGIAVVLGHMWPVCFGFRGGKGVATTFGVILAVNWGLALIGIAIVIVCVLIWRMVSLGTIIACAVVFVLFFIFENQWVYPLFMAVMVFLIIFKHRENIGRIVNGTENKVDLRSKDNGK
jgi:glycerol-3-phosphate acyltransferase PlsY